MNQNKNKNKNKNNRSYSKKSASFFNVLHGLSDTLFQKDSVAEGSKSPSRSRGLELFHMLDDISPGKTNGVCNKHKYADCHLQSFAEVFGVRANPGGFVADCGGSWKTCSAIARGFVLTLRAFAEVRRRGVGVRRSLCEYRSAWVPQWFCN